MKNEPKRGALTLQSLGKTQPQSVPNPGKVMEVARSKIVRALLRAILLGAFFGAASVQAASTEDHTIDVKGVRLHFRVSPGCGPTVLLEAGGGLDASQWAELQPKLSDATGATVVSYDRAGFGESDLPKGRYSLKVQVSWLRVALTRLHVPDAFVLVGHSYGAFLSQLFAAQYPGSTKAVILIDPNSVAFIDSIGGPQNIPIDIPADMPKKLASATTNMRDTMLENLATLRKAPLSCSIPLTVIAAGKRWLPNDEWNDKFDAARKSIVGACSNRQLIVAEGSGHMVTQESPQTVLSAVETTVDEVRKSLPDGGRCIRKGE
jgi:pimeloyl-ACP methyl ester carboxylesterase